MKNLASASKSVKLAWQSRRSAIQLSQGSDQRIELIEQAHQSLSDALVVFRQHNSLNELIDVLIKLGHVEQDMGHLEAMRARYEEAVEVSRQTKDAFAVAHTIRHLGDAQRSLKNLTAAESCYTEALSVYRKLTPSSLDLANTNRSMALLKEATGDAAKAYAHWLQARELYIEFGVQEGVDECDHHLKDLSQN